MAELDRRIEQARLLYWELVYEKARALGRSPTDSIMREAQYVDLAGVVWMGGVLGGDGWRVAGKLPAEREGWAGWGLEAAGPPWCPPGHDDGRGMYERGILGQDNLPKKARKQ